MNETTKGLSLKIEDRMRKRELPSSGEALVRALALPKEMSMTIQLKKTERNLAGFKATFNKAIGFPRFLLVTSPT